MQEMNDEGILWQVNFARFHQHFIDQVRVNALAIRLPTKVKILYCVQSEDPKIEIAILFTSVLTFVIFY